jgi:hypothetical protein
MRGAEEWAQNNVRSRVSLTYFWVTISVVVFWVRNSIMGNSDSMAFGWCCPRAMPECGGKGKTGLRIMVQDICGRAVKGCEVAVKNSLPEASFRRPCVSPRITVWSGGLGNGELYCSISFKSTLGVTRDPKNQFNISTAAKIWRDTIEIFDIETKNLPFFGSYRQFWALCDPQEVRQMAAWRVTLAKFRYR